MTDMARSQLVSFVVLLFTICVTTIHGSEVEYRINWARGGNCEADKVISMSDECNEAAWQLETGFLPIELNDSSLPAGCGFFTGIAGLTGFTGIVAFNSINESSGTMDPSQDRYIGHRTICKHEKQDSQTDDYTPLRDHFECGSEDEKLFVNSSLSLSVCAEACQATEGCEYFIYGTGWKTGRCYWEKTTSVDCPEGWEKDHYNFYSLSSSLKSTSSEGSFEESTEAEKSAESFDPTSEPICQDDEETLRHVTRGVLKACAILPHIGGCSDQIAPACNYSCGLCDKNDEDKDIVDVIFTYPDLEVLATAIHQSDFTHLLRTEENITFFAVKNSGFNAAPGMIDVFLNNQTEMYQILSRHKITGHGALTTERMFEIMEGHKGVNMTINNFEGGYIALYKNEDGNITAVEEKGFNKNRTIIERDIHASNGVIHVLDGLL